MYQFEFSGKYVILRCHGVVVSVKERQDYASDDDARQKMLADQE